MKRKFKRGDPHPNKSGLFLLYYQEGRQCWATKERLKEHRQKCCELSKKYALQDRRKRNKRLRDYYKNNPEARRKKYLRARKYAKQNPERWTAYQTKYMTKKRATNPACRLRGVMQCRLRAALKAKSLKKTSRTFKLVGCTPEFLRKHLEALFLPGMRWERKGEIHIDHKIPLSSAKTRKEFFKLFHYKNLQPLWARDNLIKSDKIL